MKFFLLMMVSLCGTRAYAYPQTIAHGYTSCTTCHYSPTGGGLMTPYGRSLSAELFSQEAEEGEEQVLYGLVKPPSFMQLSGDVRVLQSYSNSAMMEQAKFTFMQADLEMGATIDKVQLVASVGYQNPMSANATGSPILSRTHYVQYALSEQDYIRAGRFDLAFGFHWADHIMFSRRELGWDEGSESYRIEYNHVGETWRTFSTATVGRIDAPQLRSDAALSFLAMRNLSETSQAGIGIYLGKNDLGPRALVGPLLAYTFAEKATVFVELDIQKMLGDLRGNSLGAVETIRLQYEPFKGMHLFAMQEYSRMNFEDPKASKEAYTLGVQWFFRPHVEVTAGVRKQKTSPLALGFTDVGWLILHYYL